VIRNILKKTAKRRRGMSNQNLQKLNYNLFDSVDKFKTLLENAGVGIYLFSEDRFIYVNKKLMKMFGYDSKEITKKDISSLISQEERDHIRKKMEYQIKHNIEYMDYVFKGITKDGKIKYIHSYCSIMDSDDKKLLMCVLIDETKIIEANKELEKLANYDTLTNIFNKRIFEEELDRILELAKRKNSKVALILFDVDHFKRINDSFGHKGGDKILKELTKKIKNRLRKSELFARIGGDEFGLIVENFRDSDEIVTLIKRIQDSIKEQIIIENTPIRVTLSIGVATFPEHGEDKFTLLQAADIALYEAKKAGRNCYIFYAKNSKDLLENIKLGKELESALDKNQMKIHLQPQISLKDDKICSAEALIRWYHPTKGLLRPKDFLPQASKAGMLYQLDLFTLKSVLEFLRQIQDQSSLSISVNISNALFHHQRLSESIKELEVKYGDLFPRVELELDEKLLQHNDKYSRKIIKYLDDCGFLFSIDNFGIGLTSFKSLQELKVNKINIDISFIKEIVKSNKAVSIVKAITDMSHALDLLVLAEGVESKESLDILRSIGCDLAQGYYFSHPLPVEEFKKKWLKN
jgi:diguanylate cyclase (GGDEF)-like protein/PAS domain S-box-containing protein